MQKIDPNVPIGLYTLQKWFGSVITTPITDLDEKKIPTINQKHQQEAKQLIAPSKKLSSTQRIGIYKLQYWLRLFDLLKEDYPFVLRLFGDSAFEEKIATPYLMDYPSKTWELNLLGAMLPKWIKNNYQDDNDKNLIYFASLIDNAYCQILYSPEYSPISKIDASTQIFLQPYVKLFKLDANLLSFRKKFLKKDVNYWLKNPFPKLAKGRKHYFILYKEQNRVEYFKISYGEYLLLKEFEEGSSIEKSFQNFPEKLIKNANIKLWFKIWSENNWLTTQKKL